MTHNVNYMELVDSISKAETVEELHSICSGLCEEFELDHFIYCSRIPTSFVKPSLIIISGFPSGWKDRYMEKNYMTVDPVFKHCSKNITPLKWGSAASDKVQSEDARSFMLEASDFGINGGVSFPLHTAQGDFAVLSLTSEQQEKLMVPRVDQVLPIGALFTAYFHEAVRRIFESDVLPLSKVNLTNREKECLLWATEGKTTWETSQILDISERTVIFHLKNAQQKLEVNNRQQAVARAVALGIIEPQFN